MVGILERSIPAKLLMLRPNESDKLPRGWQREDGRGYQSGIMLYVSIRLRVVENFITNHASRKKQYTTNFTFSNIETTVKRELCRFNEGNASANIPDISPRK